MTKLTTTTEINKPPMQVSCIVTTNELMYMDEFGVKYAEDPKCDAAPPFVGIIVTPEITIEGGKESYSITQFACAIAKATRCQLLGKTKTAAA